ncbi:MAG TPA: IclR family transcriptional regulator C-terminal domain-containing protein [Pseudolabrys sp.]
MTAISETVLLMMAVLAAVAVAARRLHIAPSILLVVAGVGVALIPGLPAVNLAPELVLLVFLPPLIYSAGVSMSWREFRFNLRPIGLLAFGCVVFTTCAIAAAVHYLLQFSWPVATLVEYDQNTKAYSLGAGLIGLGAAASRRRDILAIGLRPVESLVQKTELTCVTFTQLPNKSFLIIAKTDSPREIKVTIDVGQYFAPGTPALARIAMTSMESSELNDYIEAYCQPKFTPVTKTDRAVILDEIEQTRRNGYAISQSEYHSGYTVAVAPVFSPQDSVCRGICLIGFSSQIKEDDLPILGAQVRATAQVITQGLGGQDQLLAMQRPAGVSR